MAKNFYLLAIVSYMTVTFFPQISWLHLFVSVFSFLAVMKTLQYVRGLTLFFGLFFLISGGLLIVKSSFPLTHLITSFGEMIEMVTLFSLVPILGLPIRIGQYAEEVREKVNQKIKNSRQFYMLTSGVAYFFSSFMNIAALPVTYYSISPSINQYPVPNGKKYLSQSITHGFAMPLLWSPVTPILATVLALTGTQYTVILPLLLALSIGGLLLDWLISARSFTSKDQNHSSERARSEIAAARENEPSDASHSSRFFQLFVFILALYVSIIFLDHFFKMSFLFSVSILIIPFAFVWSVFIRKTREFSVGLKDHFSSQIVKMQNQFFIFLSAGFFIQAMQITHADKALNQTMETLIQWMGTGAFLLILPLIPLILAFVGLHPAVSLVFISEAVRTNLLADMPIVVTVAMLGGAIPAFLMGPYNATLGIMSGLIKEKPFTLSNWNFKFTAVYLVLITFFVESLYIIFF
ncbi:hypothetical protein EWH99_12485 [Sporolactobacillus sp. THM7-7]|nr:hypothetical protein EWH99_12485 [Sporolactobacillus sp. THM7-7]